MTIAPGLLGPYLLSSSNEEEYISFLISSNKVKTWYSHSTKFIDFFSINDGGKVGRFFLEIYPTELELKLEHQGNNTSFFQNLDITIKEATFVFKLLEKRNIFLFSNGKMSHTDSNIPQNIFHSTAKGGFLRIAGSKLCFAFIAKAKVVLKFLQMQCSKRNKTDNSLWKIILGHF